MTGTARERDVIADTPPHNRLKLPVTSLCALAAFAAAVHAAVNERWPVAILLAIGVVILLLTIREIRGGRNPWWTRSPLDRRSG